MPGWRFRLPSDNCANLCTTQAAVGIAQYAQPSKSHKTQELFFAYVLKQHTTISISTGCPIISSGSIDSQNSVRHLCKHSTTLNYTRKL
eukprot:2331164-Amphidinium_carterae.1